MTVFYPIDATLWFELPFRIMLNISETRNIQIYGDQHCKVRLKVRNDIIKMHFMDFHEAEQTNTKYFADIKARKKTKGLVDSGPRLITETRFNTLKKKNPKIHGVKGSTFIEVHTKVNQYGIPPGGFIQKQLFPWMNEIVACYRMSILPSMRFPIDRLSEANLNTCHIVFGDGRVCTYGFCVRDHGKIGVPNIDENFDIESRFKKFREKVSIAEVVFSETFPLFHQGRYREALLVASSCCEGLLKELVVNSSENVKLGEALWKAYRGKSDDIFLSLLPLLGREKISDKQPQLWQKFKRARDSRNNFAHNVAGSFMTPEAVLDHLQTFYEVCKWIIQNSDGKLIAWRLELQDLASGQVVSKQFS